MLDLFFAYTLILSFISDSFKKNPLFMGNIIESINFISNLFLIRKPTKRYFFIRFLVKELKEPRGSRTPGYFVPRPIVGGGNPELSNQS